MLSLVFWALVLVVTVKDVLIIMRVDNQGEGGVLALGALAQRACGKDGRMRRLGVLLALVGTALFFGDGILTPAARPRRLRRPSGRIAEARDLLASVYGDFTEGFNLADLKAARVLLDEPA